MSVVAALKPARTVAIAVVGVGVLLAFVGCGSKENAQPECEDDKMCGLRVCMMGKCLSRGGERTVAIEILPKVDASSMRTSMPLVTLSKEKLELKAEGRAVIAGNVAGAPDARVVLTAPSTIKGQGDLQWETVLTDSTFQLGIAQSLIGTRATMWLTPTDKAPLQPPVSFATMLNATLGLAFPSTSEMTPIRATLQNSLEMAQGDYQVRASAGGRVISNVASTTATGEFQLLIAPGSIETSPIKTVTIEFAPTTDDAPLFVTVPFDPHGNAPGDNPTLFHLPAFGTPAPLRFRVQGRSPGQTPDKPKLEDLPDVSVRFHTDLLDNKTEGTGIFEREKRTTGTGEVEVDLIPGSATAPRNYQIAIVPPPGSAYAASCVPDHQVTIAGNGGGQTPYSAMFTLDPKAILSGTILGDDSKPATNVNVRATFVGGNTVCANVTSSASVSATTNRMGLYTLLLDPGIYRLDVEPPDGAPWPRQTEDGDKAIAVTPAGLTHDIKLPAGEVVIGHLLGADNAALEGATIRIFEVLCDADTCTGMSRVAPALRSQATTGAMGEFRAVLPPLR